MIWISIMIYLMIEMIYFMIEFGEAVFFGCGIQGIFAEVIEEVFLQAVVGRGQVVIGYRYQLLVFFVDQVVGVYKGEFKVKLDIDVIRCFILLFK